MRNPLFALAAAAAILALGLGIWFGQGRGLFPAADRTTAVAATVLQQPRALPGFSLVDDRGQAFGPEQLQGGWHLLFFGFTHCPDVCPNTLGLLQAVSQALRQQGGQPPRVVFVSVDPQRDSPQQLAQYVRYFDPEFIGVTGAAGEIDRLTGALYLPYSITPAAGGEYSVEHSGSLVLLDPQGRAVAYFSPPHELATVVADLRRLIRS